MNLVHGLLFIIAASSVESQNLPNDMLQDNHLISNGMTDGLQKHHKKPKYKKYKNSRCRTDEGKQGKTGEQYDTYNYIPYQYDKDKCEEKCSGDPSCTGYEFKKHRVCEIWHETSKKHKTHKEKGAYCYWKEEEKIEYKKHRGRRCRTDTDKKGSDGHEYDTYYYRDYQYEKNDCEKLCSSNNDCSGFEFKKEKRCEIWYEESKEHKTKKGGGDCYWKK